MAERGITGDTAEEIYTKLEAFSSFGFPESHSVSFAYLVYSSSWIKYHYPAEFAAVVVERAADGLLLAAHDRARRAPARRAGARSRSQRARAATRRSSRAPPTSSRSAGRVRGFHAEPSHLAVRLGLRSVRGLHDALLDRIDDERDDPPVHRPRGLRAPHRRDRRPGRSARDRGRVRAVLRPVAPVRAVGRGRATARRGPSVRRDGDGGRDAARRRHRCRRAAAAGHDRDGDGRRSTCGRWASRWGSTPPSSCATS